MTSENPPTPYILIIRDMSGLQHGSSSAALVQVLGARHGRVPVTNMSAPTLTRSDALDDTPGTPLRRQLGSGRCFTARSRVEQSVRGAEWSGAVGGIAPAQKEGPSQVDSRQTL